MAEYKGLTIRIGGDTSSLNAALKASTKAASTLQYQIRQITRAMRFDPGSLANVSTRMKLTADRAEALYQKAMLTRTAMEQLGDTSVSIGGVTTKVKELAESTDNVTLAAKTAEKRYNDMTETLASKYRELEARAKEAGQAMNLNALSREGSDTAFEKQMAELKELGVITDEEIQKLRSMRATWHEAFEGNEAYKAAADFEKMGVDIQRFESEARGSIATVRELNNVSKYSANNWQESAAKVKQMDSALSECEKQARAYEAALRKDPSNLTAAVGRLKALSNEYDLAEGKASELSRQVEAYKSRLSGVLAEHKNLPKYIQEAGDGWQKVQSELSEAKGKADALHQSLQKIKDKQMPVEEIKQLEAAVQKADARVDELNADARRMDAAFETAKECAELRQLETELAETSARAKSLKERMSLTSLGGKSMLNASTIKSAGMTLYSTLTPAITMLGWRAVTAAQDIDSAYRDMRKTVDGTEAQFESLKQGAIEFSKTHVTSATQLLEIEAIGGELGVAVDDLEKFAETVSNLDVATNYETEEAATMLGQLANITHMTADEYEGFSDALVRLGNNGASTETQIGDISTRIGSMGTIVGMSTSDILAWSSTLASTGQQAEAAGTAFSKTMSLMETAVAAAGGTMDTSFDAIDRAVREGGDKLTIFASLAGQTADEFAEAWSSDSTAAFDELQAGLDDAKGKLQKIADVAHMSADKFAETWENDPTDALRAFVMGLNDVEDSGGSADAVLTSLGITGARQKQAIEGLMQTIGLLDDNLTMSEDAWNGVSDQWGAAGDAAREADRKAEGFSGQLSILSNIANDAMASLMDGATPLLTMFTNVAKSALDMFDGMDEGAKTTAVLGLAFGALAGPALTMASTFMTAKQNVVKFATESNAMAKALVMLKTGFAEAGAGAGSMAGKLKVLGAVGKTVGKALAKDLAVVAVIAGITAVIGAINDYMAKLKEAETASRNAGDTISLALGGAAQDAEGNVESLTDSYDSMVRKMAESNNAILASAKETYGNTALIEDYGDAVKEALAAYEDDGSARNLARLKTALELYNDAAGTSITLSQDENGQLKLMKDNAELTGGAFDSLTASMVNAAKAQFFQEAYTRKVGDYHDALDEVAKAEADVKKYAAEMADAENDAAATAAAEKWRDANRVLDESKQKLGETQSAMNQYEEGRELMAEAQLENASGAVVWLSEQDEIQSKIWANCESATDFAHRLADLGVSYDELAEHGDDIAKMASDWDGSTSQIIDGLADMGVELDLSKEKVEGLDKVKIGGKTYKVDDGGTVRDQEGKLAGFDSITIDGKDYWVSDDGTIYDSKKKIGELEGGIATISGKKFAISDDGSATKSKKDVDGLNSSIERTKDKEVDVKANVSGKSAVDDLISSIRNLGGKTVDIITNHISRYSTVESATGSVSGNPYIPRHASGYIATGATLTNNGWVGEDGAEAVLNWATGGAVVPLTNRRYMEPIARAIAANMGDARSSGGGVREVNVYLQYDSTKEARQMARDVADELNAILAMGA